MKHSHLQVQAVYNPKTMQNKIKQLLQKAVTLLQDNGQLPKDLGIEIRVDHASPKHGDFATNFAMLCAKVLKTKPMEIAELIVKALPYDAAIAKVEVAGGFINFYVAEKFFHAVVENILKQQDKYGTSKIGAGKMVMVEFVSANPTGPLHVGHGRGAAYGSTVADLLEAVGFKVHREYYVNDAGRQMHVLALSVWLRYLELCGAELHFPASGYKGAYIIDIARRLYVEHGKSFYRVLDLLTRDLPADENDGGDKEFYVDAMIARAQSLLSVQDYRTIFNAALQAILADIREDLREFGVAFQEWFYESHLVENGDVARGIAKLKQAGYTYERDHALWFKATDFGDEKDRVLMRSNGQTTYFASDVGYHLNKFERGFDVMLNIFGADHHGYAPRLRAFLQALGLNAAKVIVLLVQFAVLYRGKEKVPMSTRSGEFVTLRKLREEVGNDAARFFYLMRKNDQHLDFDLELAKSRSLENPVYYIQYAHARICGVFAQLRERGEVFDEVRGVAQLPLLQTEHEKQLLAQVARYAETLENAALNYAPHILAHYLRDLAALFHTYYNASQFLVSDEKLRAARLSLVGAIGQVLANGLGLLGVSSPETM